MHESIRDLGRPRGLDDFLDETLTMAAEGAQAARRIFTAADLDRFARDAGADEVIDGTSGPRIQLPREPRVVRSITLEQAAGAVTVDDHLKTPDELLEERRQREREDDDAEAWAALPQAERDRRDAVALRAAAKGARRVHGAGGSGDKGPKARRTGGAGSMAGPTKMKHEVWDHERAVGGRPRKGKDVRERFSVRAEPATRATIAQTGRSESDFLAEAAKLVSMARTGAQADELMRAVIALAGASEAA